MTVSEILKNKPSAEGLSRKYLFVTLRYYMSDILWLPAINDYIKTIQNEIDKRGLKEDYKRFFKNTVLDVATS